MRIWVINLNTDERTDITQNLYWFKEKGLSQVDEHGEGTTLHGERYRVYIEEWADGT